MMDFCLIGHPLSHSISPEIHSRLFALSGTEGTYSLKDLAPEALEAEMSGLRTLAGFNVTIPYKQQIIPLLDDIEANAKRYDAVNTVKYENGRLRGYNTDVRGFLAALKLAGIELSGRVLLCGAGGVAHMMAYEALDRGCSLVVATPTLGEARRFTEELNARYPSADVEPSALAYVSGSFDLILNGTPSGMFPNVKDCPVPLAVARSAGSVFDAVYNPLETRLLSLARAAGATVQSGLPMLVSQAAASQEIWTGATFSPADIENVCAEMKLLLSRAETL